MNVLSLFDGMSCGQIALERACIHVDRYYASEVDKYAIQVTQQNYPNTVQLGDVTNWREWDIDWRSIDLLIGGSPCQGFSYSGKELNFNDPRSKLFFYYVEILNHIRSLNPNIKFMLENVKMRQAFADVITDKLGVTPLLIDSALLSAQRRLRYYWVNWDVQQPSDANIKLSSVLQSDYNYNPAKVVGRKLNEFGKRDDSLKQKNIQYLEVKADNSKMWCLTTVQKDSVLTPLSAGRHAPPYEYRRLTPVECERLQTVPDNYTDCVSNTQRYKMIGNGFTVDVIAHILKQLKETI